MSRISPPRLPFAARTPGEIALLAAGPAAAAGVLLARWWPSPLEPFCLFHRLTGLPCFTCGAFRCARLLARGRLGEAWLAQPLLATVALAAVALSACAWLALAFRLPLPRRLRLTRRAAIVWGAIGAALAVANWVYLIVTGR